MYLLLRKLDTGSLFAQKKALLRIYFSTDMKKMQEDIKKLTSRLTSRARLYIIYLSGGVRTRIKDYRTETEYENKRGIV